MFVPGFELLAIPDSRELLATSKKEFSLTANFCTRSLIKKPFMTEESLCGSIESREEVR